jgi:hypothetical protein
VEYCRKTSNPERNELEASFGELIVPGCQLMATRAKGRPTLARTYCDLNAFVIGAEVGLLINKTPEMMTSV